MFAPDTIIKRYRVTEKATELISNQNKYTFEVYPSVNRRQVAAAVERLFDVKVVRVNILNQAGKTKRSRTVRGQTGSTPAIKKAIVTLQPGDSIELA